MVSRALVRRIWLPFLAALSVLLVVPPTSNALTIPIVPSPVVPGQPMRQEQMADLARITAGGKYSEQMQVAAEKQARSMTIQHLPDGITIITAPLIAMDRASSSGLKNMTAQTQGEFSPAGCRIVYVDNPHFSRSVPGAVKTNSKVQCNGVVQTLSLGVNLYNTTHFGKAAGTNVTKDNVPFLDNRNTFVRCTDPRPFQFQSGAGAVSIENGRGYSNAVFGNVTPPLPCGYPGA